jgi:N-methylhydantoinase B
VEVARRGEPAADLDPVALSILWSRLQGVVDEAETTLMRTAFSPIVREAFDFGVLLLDAGGGSVAQSQRSLPSFVGTLPRTLQAALELFPAEDWQPGDVYATNDPWLGTGHLPDVTMVRPIFRAGCLIAYSGCIAHWADIGGAIWSSDTTEVFEEGLRLPLMKLVDRGTLNPFIAEIIRGNVRLPEQVMGDLHAQLATLQVAERRLLDILDELESDDPATVFSLIQERSEAAMRAAIAKLPDGRYTHEMEIDGVDEPLLLRVTLAVEGDSIAIDWTGSSPQCPRGINETYNHAYAMSVYPIKCVLLPEIPNNQGAYRPISMHAPEGSIINARYPAPVASRQILGHCVANAVMGALGEILPEECPADAGSPSPRVVFTGLNERGRKFGAALLLAGGMGGQRDRDGLSATPFPSNPGMTSVEVLEAGAPLVFRRRALIPDSGGVGRHRGGLGAVTEVEFLADRPGVVSVMTDRVEHPPLGRMGGGPGRPNIISRNGVPIEPKRRTTIEPGDVLSIETAGGAGYGAPSERDRGLIERDLEYGYVTPEGS